MRHKILTAFFVLIAVASQIFTPAYAGKAQDTALFLAAQKGNVDEVKRLLAVGVKINAVSKAGEQAVHYAAHYGNNVELVKTLLAKGAKVDAVNVGGYQPIHLAAQSGNVEIVQALLLAGAKIDAKTANRYEAQPIHFAAQSGNAELVKVLLAAGAKADAQDNDGNPPYFYIQNKGDPELVKNVLIAAGAQQVPTALEKLRSNMKPIWLEHIGPQISLGVSDKMMLKQSYIAKYIVKCETGKTYSVEKTATAGNSPETWQATFPQDFHSDIKGLDIQQAYGCGLSKLAWTIYADDILIDSGTLISTRKGARRIAKQDELRL